MATSVLQTEVVESDDAKLATVGIQTVPSNDDTEPGK